MQGTNVLGSDNPDRTLASILEVADCLDRVILLADDFDKGFTGWSSEIKRRFDDGGIWFVDLPSMGAMYEIFLIHLSKYFPTQFEGKLSPWSDRDWYRLLKQYRGATPVEIALYDIRLNTPYVE